MQLFSICNALRAALGNGFRNTNVVSKSVACFFSVNLVAALKWRLVHSLVAFTAVLLFRTSLVFADRMTKNHWIVFFQQDNLGIFYI